MKASKSTAKKQNVVSFAEAAQENPDSAPRRGRPSKEIIDEYASQVPEDEDEELVFDTIKNALKALRYSHGYTQADVAEAIGASPSAYSKYERAGRIPDLSVLVNISNLYSINIGYLLFLACLGEAQGGALSIDDVFKAYSHSNTLPESDAILLGKCNRLSSDERENLHLFLSAATECDKKYGDK